MLFLETARLTLLPFTPADLDFLHALWIDPQVRRYLWDDQIISREQAHEVIEDSQSSFATAGYGFWLLRLKENNRPVGFCGLRQFSDAQVGEGQIEILYGITPADWGRGLVVEAARATLCFGFGQMQLERIYAGADPPNAASFRVMEKLGMRFDHQTQLHGREAIYYAITRECFNTLV
jgi:[ribosomal protein S5]-alanine N-acetyltransferase